MTPTPVQEGRPAPQPLQALMPQAAPYLRARLRADALMWTLLAAAAGLWLVGWVFYGPTVLVLGIAALATAALTEWLCAWTTHRYSISSLAHSLAMGMIVVLMLPAGPIGYATLAAAAMAVAAAVGIGKWLMGGLGHYPWHPSLVGLIVLYMLWPSAVNPQRWPLLSREHVLTGGGLDLAPLQPAPVVLDWSRAVPAGQAIGFALPRTETVLHRAATQTDTGGNGAVSAFRPAEAGRDTSAADAGENSLGAATGPTAATGQNPATGSAPATAQIPATSRAAATPGPLTTAVRDLLPNSWDMLIGATAAPIGQGSTVALIAAGLLLIWRGYLRWALPLAVLAGAILAAAILPAGEAGWFPVRYVAEGEPVGLIYVSCQVLLGSTLFAAVMLAGETVTSPLTNRGQVIYGLAVGVLTVGLRWGPVAALSACWAVLAMNTLVPLVDHLDRRWRRIHGG
jgi:Na+-translocating ferredoxin:NAD+ oxidoreductase RnfD subunit